MSTRPQRRRWRPAARPDRGRDVRHLGDVRHRPDRRRLDDRRRRDRADHRRRARAHHPGRASSCAGTGRAARSRPRVLRRSAGLVTRLRPGRRRGLPAGLLQRRAAAQRRRRPAAGVPRRRPRRALDVAAARPAAAPADRARLDRRDRRAGARPRPDRQPEPRPDRRALGSRAPRSGWPCSSSSPARPTSRCRRSPWPGPGWHRRRQRCSRSGAGRRAADARDASVDVAPGRAHDELAGAGARACPSSPRPSPTSPGSTAARRLGARLASFVGLTEVLFAVLFAWLLLDQLPARIQLVGGVLIVAGIALVRIDELARRRRDRPRAGGGRRCWS